MLAQPDVEIWWDPTNIADTVMDFGVTLEGAPVTLTFKVVNKTSQDVGILRSNPDADPYYLILNTPEVNPEDPRKEEFQAAMPLPYVVAPGDTGSFGVTYRALKNNPLYPPDVATEALLELRVVFLQDSLGPSTNHRFLLRAIKTTKVLASSVQRIAYDSVYVLPAPFPPQTPYRVENVMSTTVPVEQQLLQMKTSVVGLPEIEVETKQSPVVFGPQASLTWTTRYAPRDRGRDSAHFLVVYRLNENAVDDTVQVIIDGTGVEQKLAIVNATGSPQPVQVSGDTIHFGNVNADGKGGVTATVIVRNDGNVNMRMLSETKAGTIERDTAAFKIERVLSSGGNDIKTNRFDTLIVRFAPVDGGTHRMRYEIRTDLGQRGITGVPDGAETKTLYFDGFARKPQMGVAPLSVSFGSVVLLPQCNSAATRNVVITNSGNVELIVDSVVVDPPGAQIQVTPDFLRIDVARSDTLRLRYEPQQLETLNARIILYTNAFGEPLEIPCFGSSIGPDSIRVGVDTTLRSRPGTPIAVAVMVDGDRVKLAETSTVTLTYDPSLMLYRSVLQGATASEGATVVPVENPRGTLTVDLNANGAFMDRDTLIIVTFETFLGDLPRTAISLSSLTTQFGNSGCASVLDVTTENGAFSLDSICGLDYRTASVQGFYVDASIFPNPAVNDVVVTVASGKAQQVTARVLDVFGRDMAAAATRDVAAGLDMISIPVAHLLSGSYYVEVVSTRQRLVLPLVIER